MFECTRKKKYMLSHPRPVGSARDIHPKNREEEIELVSDPFATSTKKLSSVRQRFTPEALHFQTKIPRLTIMFV